MPSQFYKPKPLTHKLTKRLLAYATVAGAAAGVSSPAAAEIVYTPAHAKINTDLYLDLNHDGIGDFHIHSSYFSGIGHLSVFPMVQGNRIASTQEPCLNPTHNAAALRLGDMIGPGVALLAKANCMAMDTSGYITGPWGEVKNRYLGFAFVIDGKEHFGWARLSTNIFAFDSTTDILGYAYETIPNKPIVAGDEGQSEETSTAPSLGALALGNSGLAVWRTKETSLNEVLTGDGK
ncbi:MAG: hypothetical protein WAL56_20815 [Candidatus Sulfotelmatobacter sp.]